MIDIGNFIESLEFQGRELEEALESLENKYENLFFALESPRSDFPMGLIVNIEELKKQAEISYLNEAQEIYDSFKNEISNLDISDCYEQRERNLSLFYAHCTIGQSEIEK